MQFNSWPHQQVSMMNSHQLPKYKFSRTTEPSSGKMLGILKYMLMVLTQQTVIAFRNKSWGLIKADFIIFVLFLPTPNLTIN